MPERRPGWGWPRIERFVWAFGLRVVKKDKRVCWQDLQSVVYAEAAASVKRLYRPSAK